MSKKSKILKNWPRYVLQWGILAALILFLTGIIPSKEPANPEALCPMGGLQALVTWLVNGSLPCSMTTLQIMMGIVLAAAVVLFSKLFCGYLCPLGTVQDLLAKARRSLHVKALPVRTGSVVDKVLRIFKYALVFWVFYMTATASELFCKNFDPYYAVATGFKGEITLWMSIVSLVLTVAFSFFIDNFLCRYICPLGAISNSLKFWIWIVVLFGVYYVLGLVGVNIPWFVLLGAFCLAGYLLEIFCRKPSPSLLYMMKNQETCNHCGACMKRCPYHIDINSFNNGKIDSVDCTLCGECAAVCNTGALEIGVIGTKGRKWMKAVPAVLAVLLVCFGIWAGGKFELPTIDVTWDIEKVAEDGTVTQLKDPATLKTMEVTGLRSVKCYGSSMAFKATLSKIQGVHGVKTFVKHHRAVITYDPAVITPEKIQELIYVPSKFRVNNLDPQALDSLKIVTIRTENMSDKMDINYLGLQMRNTGKKIYGLETEYDCPIIVRIYMDPAETIDKKWCKEVVEMKTLVMPVHGGGTKEIDVDYEFVKMEEGESYISTEDFLKKMFNPFKAEFKKRVEAAAGKEQFIYEYADASYEKPIILRGMPFLSNHLSKNDGIIGIYLNLNEELIPAIQIRYTDPMTEDRLYELMTMPKWSITYKADDVREVDAKLAFPEKGTVKKYE